MDEYGLDVQVLYPNIVGFQAPLLVEVGPEFALACTEAYNDFALEWSSADPNRLIPIAMLPYWDRDACVRELHRCVGRGYRGVLFANKFQRVGLPVFHRSVLGSGPTPGLRRWVCRSTTTSASPRTRQPRP